MTYAYCSNCQIAVIHHINVENKVLCGCCVADADLNNRLQTEFANEDDIEICPPEVKDDTIPCDPPEDYNLTDEWFIDV